MAQLLEQRLGWAPSYWVTRPENHAAVLEAFPDIVAHKVFDINRGLPAEQLDDAVLGALSQDDLSAAREFEAIAMDLLDRIDLGRSFSYQERQRLFHKLLIYWINAIKRLDLNVAVFNAPPHSIGEYMAYAAFSVLGRKTRIFRPTPVNGLHFVCDNVDKLPDYLDDAYQRRLSIGAGELAPEIQEHLDGLRTVSSDYKPWYSERARTREDKREKKRSLVREALEKGELVAGPLEAGQPIMSTKSVLTWKGPTTKTFNILNRTRKPQHDTPMRQAFKLPDRPVSSPPMSKWDFVTYRDWALVNKLVLEKRYTELCEPADLDRDFVYFSMHYQPERTTCPDGGRFSNQFLAISLIAATMPRDWVLYVKEHPAQFSFHGKGEMCRWEGYYEELSAIPNLRFVSLETPSLDLTDRAKAVATITGTAGWEALVRGKPVLCFGAAWYGLCRGAYPVATKRDALKAFEGIQDGSRPKDSDVECYVAALADIGQTIYTNPRLAKAYKPSGDLAESLASLICNFEKLPS